MKKENILFLLSLLPIVSTHVKKLHVLKSDDTVDMTELVSSKLEEMTHPSEIENQNFDRG